MNFKDVMRNTVRIFIEPGNPADARPPAVEAVSPGPSESVVLPILKARFENIYRLAAIGEAPLPAEKIYDMLSRLPANLDAETKRQMIRELLATLGKPEGVTLESIAADASAKIQTLSAHVKKSEAEAAALLDRTQSEIGKLQAQIESKRRAMETSEQEQAELTQQCHAESKRLKEVLEFFQPLASAANTSRKSAAS